MQAINIRSVLNKQNRGFRAFVAKLAKIFPIKRGDNLTVMSSIVKARLKRYSEYDFKQLGHWKNSGE